MSPCHRGQRKWLTSSLSMLLMPSPCSSHRGPTAWPSNTLFKILFRAHAQRKGGASTPGYFITYCVPFRILLKERAVNTFKKGRAN